jgi:outer membrane protein OmpA-like peptidoglycan-associated protein
VEPAFEIAKERGRRIGESTRRNPSSHPPVHPLLALQQQAGNQAVQRLLQSGVVQARLAISSPGDLEERQADKIAQDVMRSPAAERSTHADAGNMSEKSSQQHGAIERRSLEAGRPAVPHPAFDGAPRSPGQPLDAQTSAFFEPRLGYDFANVRIHTDAQANRLSSALAADAFTLGNDIYFNKNRYDPRSNTGQTLLAHELVHVTQQSAQSAGTIQRSMQESLTPTALGGFELGLETRKPPASPGMEGTIKFLPDPTGPYSTDIALIQTANVVDIGGATTPHSGAPLDWSGGEAARNQVRTPGGTFIDMIYGGQRPGSAPTANYVQPADIAADPLRNHNGWLRSPTDVREASLYDDPNWTQDADFKLETIAKGTDNRVVYGSLEWGFKIRAGVVQDEYRHQHALESAEFDAALERFRGYYTHESIVLYFDTDRDLPMAAEETKLGDVLSYMHRYPDTQLKVEGYADEVGAAGHNRELSLRRAQNVADILAGMGVDPARIMTPIPRGATPAFSAGSPAAAAGSLRANRRVVITFIRTATAPIKP